MKYYNEHQITKELGYLKTLSCFFREGSDELRENGNMAIYGILKEIREVYHLFADDSGEEDEEYDNSDLVMT